MFTKRIKNIIRDQSGLEVGEYLGQGAFGQVRETSRNRWVAKVTTSKEEAGMIRLIMKLRRKGFRFPALPHYRNLIRYGRDKAIIIREKLSMPDGRPWREECNIFDALEARNLKLIKGIRAPHIRETIRDLKTTDLSVCDVCRGNSGYSIYDRSYRKKNSIVIFDFMPASWYMHGGETYARCVKEFKSIPRAK